MLLYQYKLFYIFFEGDDKKIITLGQKLKKLREYRQKTQIEISKIINGCIKTNKKQPPN